MVPLLASRTAHSPNEGPRLRNIITTLLVLATIFVALRIAARLRRGLSYGWDDVVIVFSLVSIMFYFSLTHEIPTHVALLLWRQQSHVR